MGRCALAARFVSGPRVALTRWTSWTFHAQVARGRDAGDGRGRFHHRRHQGNRRCSGRRHHHPGRAAILDGTGRVQTGQAAGLRRLYSPSTPRTTNRCATPGQAQAQRFGAALRAGSFGGAGFRLPLRVPGAAAYGHRAGAAGARVQAGSDHQCADGDLRDPADRWRADRGGQSGQAAAKQ